MILYALNADSAGSPDALFRLCAEAADASDCLASDSWLHGLTIVVESMA